MTWRVAVTVALALLLGLVLRVYHLHNPILDHPAWRQGDESAIARNFLELRNNIFYPQTDYDGPPPNYVELELQIVPFGAAQLYKMFGVHEILARLLVIAFSLATIPLMYALAARLYSQRAGIIAAFLWAITPGAVYYGRAIIPESDMLFFSIGALLFWWRWLELRRNPDFLLAAAFAAVAFLAKPPAVLILAPMLAVWFSLMRSQQPSAGRNAVSVLGSDWSPYALLAISLLPLALYFHHLHRIAEWHWTSGITAIHVVPTVLDELAHPAKLLAGIQSSLALLRMLATTILGPVLFGLVLVAPLLQPPAMHARARSVFFGVWFVALAIYMFTVVQVERVDYYLMLVVPCAVLYASGALDYLLTLVSPQGIDRRIAAALIAAGCCTLYVNMLEIHPYYTWSRGVFAAANEVRAKLEPGTLVVMGHYDPSVLYTIGHRGWEEDVSLWTVSDMTSAIAKGARYFVAVEVPRFKANKSLYAFMQRYQRVPVRSGWQVYDMQHPRLRNRQ